MRKSSSGVSGSRSWTSRTPPHRVRSRRRRAGHHRFASPSTARRAWTGSRRSDRSTSYESPPLAPRRPHPPTRAPLDTRLRARAEPIPRWHLSPELPSPPRSVRRSPGKASGDCRRNGLRHPREPSEGDIADDPVGKADRVADDAHAGLPRTVARMDLVVRCPDAGGLRAPGATWCDFGDLEGKPDAPGRSGSGPSCPRRPPRPHPRRP